MCVCVHQDICWGWKLYKTIGLLTLNSDVDAKYSEKDSYKHSQALNAPQPQLDRYIVIYQRLFSTSCFVALKSGFTLKIHVLYCHTSVPFNHLYVLELNTVIVIWKFFSFWFVLFSFFRFSALSTMWRLTLNTQSGMCWRQSTRKILWRTSSRLDLKCTQGSCSACPRLTCPPRKRTLSRCTSFFGHWRRSSTSGSLTTGGTLSGIINRTLRASPGRVVMSCTISTWTLSTTVMSFFIRRIPNCSTEWAAISLYEFCEQEWCHFSSEGVQIVPLNGLHYLNLNFVNKSDVIFHQKDSRLFH